MKQRKDPVRRGVSTVHGDQRRVVVPEHEAGTPSALIDSWNTRTSRPPHRMKGFIPRYSYWPPSPDSTKSAFEVPPGDAHPGDPCTPSGHQSESVDVADVSGPLPDCLNLELADLALPVDFGVEGLVSALRELVKGTPVPR